jgi:hypothetical protein
MLHASAYDKMYHTECTSSFVCADGWAWCSLFLLDGQVSRSWQHKLELGLQHQWQQQQKPQHNVD